MRSITFWYWNSKTGWAMKKIQQTQQTKKPAPLMNCSWHLWGWEGGWAYQLWAICATCHKLPCGRSSPHGCNCSTVTLTAWDTSCFLKDSTYRSSCHSHLKLSKMCIALCCLYRLFGADATRLPQTGEFVLKLQTSPHLQMFDCGVSFRKCCCW